MYGSPAPDLHLSLDEQADALLSRDPLALLVGMLLDQQVPMEWAFAGPRIIAERLGKQLGVRPPGWQQAAGPYGEDGSRRSVADVVDSRTLGEVRAYKQQMKAARKAGSA